MGVFVGGADGDGGLHVLNAHQFGNLKGPFFKDIEQIIGQVDVALVDLVHDDHAGLFSGQQCCPQGTQADVVADVAEAIAGVACHGSGDGIVVAIGVLQPGDRVVEIQPIL